MNWYYHILIIVLISSGFTFVERWVYEEWPKVDGIIGTVAISSIAWFGVYWLYSIPK